VGARSFSGRQRVVTSSSRLFRGRVDQLFRFGFDAGLVVDGIEEPRLPAVTRPKAQARWHEMPEIPPILVVRMRRATDDGR